VNRFQRASLRCDGVQSTVSGVETMATNAEV
jgi:hypothetical protein